MLISQESIRELDLFLLQIMNIVKDAQQTKGLRASGDSAKSLYVQVEENVNGIRGAVIDGSGSFEYQERGRGPGGVPWGKIYTWLRYKKYGFEWSDVKERKQMAFAIWNKIKKYGSHTHIEKKLTGVVSDVVNETLLNKFIEIVGARVFLEVQSDVVKSLTK